MIMRQIVVLSSVWVCLAIPKPSTSQSVVSQRLGPREAAAIDSFVTATMRARRVPGVAAAVIENGSVVYEKAFGLANLETEAPVTLHSVFELASLTKEFTAVAIMMLVEEGKVKLDAPISAYIDSTPAAWTRITVRHLLTHTSGLFAGGIVFSQGSPLMNITTAQAFAFLTGARAVAPGEVGAYSDGGYFLLGMIIERASGTTYRDFIQRRIFTPLEMSETSLTDRRRVIKGRVATYEIANGQVVNWRRDWDHELPSFFGVWSTVGDVAKWDASLLRHTLVPQAALDQMWSPARLSDGRDALVDARQYGFGFRIDQIRGHPLVWHNGASGTILLHFLDEPISIVVLTNLANTAGRHAPAIADGIAGLIRQKYVPAQWLPPAPDAAPETTRAMQAVLTDMAAGRVSERMTAAHSAYLLALRPSMNEVFGRALAGLETLTFIACDDVSGKGIRITEPIARMCYYKAMAGGRLTYFTFWLTPDNSVAHVRLSGPDEY